MKLQLASDTLWALAAIAGIVLGIIVAFLYSTKIKESGRFRKVLSIVMASGVVIVVVATALRRADPGPCVYQINSPEDVTISFLPQSGELQYSVREGCGRGDLKIRQPQKFLDYSV